jgi:fatty-acyl-CoA synthase
MIVNAEEVERQEFNHTVKVMTAGAPPPVSTIKSIESIGFHITHTYGLTETYGPATVCAWHDNWNKEPIAEQARLKSRQGVQYPVLESLSVRDSKTMKRVKEDGKTMGEVMFRGNNLMKGYLKNPAATKEAFSGGYFHSGDLAVMHPDGYIELKDRSKDIIISGGENISSIEVENALYMHPNVLTAAVVAKPDEKWGESPCAFIELKDPNAGTTEEDIITHSRNNLAHFKCPRKVIFGTIPKTSTGKLQKFLLRQKITSIT